MVRMGRSGKSLQMLKKVFWLKKSSSGGKTIPDRKNNVYKDREVRAG